MFDLKYLHDEKGKVVAVQVPLKQWESLIKKLSDYERGMKMKNDLKQAFKEVKLMQKGKLLKKGLSDLLN